MCRYPLDHFQVANTKVYSLKLRFYINYPQRLIPVQYMIHDTPIVTMNHYPCTFDIHLAFTLHHTSVGLLSSFLLITFGHR